MIKEKAAQRAVSNPRVVMQTFLQALNDEDFNSARDCIGEDMHFAGVLGTRDGAGALKTGIECIGP